jgi:hypothetical protein
MPALAGTAGGQAGAGAGLAVQEQGALGIPRTFQAQAYDGSFLVFGTAPFELVAADGSRIGANIGPTGYYGPVTLVYRRTVSLSPFSRLVTLSGLLRAVPLSPFSQLVTLSVRAKTLRLSAAATRPIAVGGRW